MASTTEKLYSETARLTGMDDLSDLHAFLKQVLDCEPEYVTEYALKDAIAVVQDAVEARDQIAMMLSEAD